MNFITVDNRILFYNILPDNIFQWPYSYELESEFLTILELKKAIGIEFKPSFNHSISQLPACIKIIRFPYNSEFNQPVDNLPSGVEHLELYDKFNQTLNCLPHGLKKLIINAKFNHPLNNLPAELEYLEIRGNFNHPLDNLPLELKELRIKDAYDYEDYHIRMCIIREYGLLSQFNLQIKELPPNLKVIELSHKLFNKDNIEQYGNALDIRKYNIFTKYKNLHTIII
jgi:hypothetical protein